jgi:hypothetical protein
MPCSRAYLVGAAVPHSNPPLNVTREMMVGMDITKMLAELKAEREGIEQAIVVLERIASGGGERRGRPPAWTKTIKRRGRPKGSKNKPKEG